MTRLSPKFFILPLIALVVIGSLPAPADTGAGNPNAGCGPAISRIQDPAMRQVFAAFDRTQSAAAAKVCAIYRNSVEAPASR